MFILYSMKLWAAPKTNRIEGFLHETNKTTTVAINYRSSNDLNNSSS